MVEVYRHGEVALVKVKSLPKGLKKVDTKIFMVGSHGHNHSIDNGELYFINEGTYGVGYLKAKNTKLFHEEHSPKGVKIKDGIYQLLKQQEFTPQGLIPVID